MTFFRPPCLSSDTPTKINALVSLQELANARMSLSNSPFSASVAPSNRYCSLLKSRLSLSSSCNSRSIKSGSIPDHLGFECQRKCGQSLFFLQLWIRLSTLTQFFSRDELDGSWKWRRCLSLCFYSGLISTHIGSMPGDGTNDTII